MLVKAVKPVRGGRQISNLLCRHILGYELTNWMADEGVTLLDIVPDPVPNSSSGRVVLVCQICSYLNMTAEDDWSSWVLFFSNLDKRGHLRVVDNDDIRTAFKARCERTTLSYPITFGILPSPLIENIDGLLVKTETGLLYALQDVVVVLGDTKDCGLGLWHVPAYREWIAGIERVEDSPSAIDVDQP
jgi:hypothetical protein